MKISIDIDPAELRDLVRMTAQATAHDFVHESRPETRAGTPALTDKSKVKQLHDSLPVPVKEIRRWAREDKGMAVAKGGNLPHDVIEMWLAEHTGQRSV